MAKGYKSPLTSKTIDERREFVTLAERYLGSLTDRIGGIRLIDTNRKTGFLGFIVSARSMLGIFDEIVELQSIQQKMTKLILFNHE